jgi:hypothetical protein
MGGQDAPPQFGDVGAASSTMTAGVDSWGKRAA